MPATYNSPQDPCANCGAETGTVVLATFPDGSRLSICITCLDTWSGEALVAELKRIGKTHLAKAFQRQLDDQ
jgi:hypothetical protein